MRVSIRAHQNKHLGLTAAIERTAHRVVISEPDVLLIDHDGPEWYADIIAAYGRAGIPSLVYPHGATSQVAWDGIYPVSNDVLGYLAFSEGHAEVMRRYGYPKPVHVTGWHWCEQRSYQMPPVISRVLFAPIHPLNDYSIRAVQAEANRRAMHDILSHVPPQAVTVRHIGKLEGSGLERVEGVTYVWGRADNSTDDIDRADVVVSAGTFAYLAIARGKPTVIINQHIHPAIEQDGHTVKAMHWHYYRDYLHYPVSYFNQLGASVEEWRDRMIGPQITPERMGAVLEEAVDV